MLVPSGRYAHRRIVRNVVWAALVLLLGLAPLAPPETAGASTTLAPPDLTGPTGTSSTTPTFTWKAIGGSVSGYLVYDLAAGKDVSVYQTYTPATLGCPNAGATCSAPAPAPLSAGNHQFWVVAYNAEGWAPGALR